MLFQEKKLTATDGKELTYFIWSPQQAEQIKAVVQIAHGMAEHAQRYDQFARFLVEHGFAVFANDHRGHGATAGSTEQIGYFSEEDFWEKAMKDLRTIKEEIKLHFPEQPLFLFGHSMGSLLGRDFITEQEEGLRGAVFSGTSGDPGLLGKVGLGIAKVEAFFRGRQQKSPLLNLLSFGKFNHPFKPNRTAFDWLSRDESEVDQYIADPRCGTVFSTGFFISLVQGVQKVNNAATFVATPNDLPVLLIAGDRDPVGDMGKGVKEVHEKYNMAGLEDVTCRLYENARHEVLNETNKEEVFQDIREWLERNLG